MNDPESQTSDFEQFELKLELFPSKKLSTLLTPDEIYQTLDSYLVAQLAEDRRIERKGCNYQPRAFGDYFSMWANTSPQGGVILVGVRNDGSIEGMSQCPASQLNDIEDSPRIYCPDARVESRRIQVTNSKGEADFILAFRVRYRPDKVVRSTTGRAFQRSGDNKRELSEEEIRELQISKGEVHHELESVPLTYPDDFDASLLKTFAKNVKASKDLKYISNISEILVQQRLGVITDGKFIPNNACCLLFAKDPMLQFPGCKLRFMRFEGESEKSGEEYTLVKDVMIEGPIPRIIVEAEKVISAQLREYSALNKDGRFYAVPEYPLFAWYEAIVNACVHRSYNMKNMHIFVKMFDDKLIVSSPGGFLPMVTPENIFSLHSPRNPFLMEALRFFGYVKCANEGTRRMKDAMLTNNLPVPKFSQASSDHHPVVNVTLSNNYKHRRRFVDSNAAKNVVSEIVFRTLSEDDLRIINYSSEYQKINVSQAVRLLNIDWGSAKKKLDNLVAKGVLKHKHRKDLLRDPKAYYTLAVS